MKLGSHLSIAGGMDRALRRAGEYGFATVAVFLRSQVQWYVPPLQEEAVRTFRRERRRLGIGPVVAHGSYLVNLAGRAALRRKSIAAMKADLARCGRLGIEYLVLHPGSRADADYGIDRIAEALNEIVATCPHRRPKVLLETTAGAGNILGARFEELAAILDRLDRPRRFGVCLDTCHIFAAGYDIRTPGAYRKTMTEFDRVIGLERLLAVHVNDSKGELGSRRDRHEHIGRGRIGRRGIANFVNDPRLARVPLILETPKGTDQSGRDWDLVNAEVIRSLVRPGGRALRKSRKRNPCRDESLC